MGIRLVMESTSRHAPGGLTWRERYSLIVLAASAIDATRELPPGIEDNPEIIARLRLGRSERYAVFASLVSKGALERLERGRNGVKAVYAIASFDPATEAARPGDPDAHPVDNPDEGSGESGCFSSAKGPGSVTEGSGFDPLKGPGFPDPAPYMGVRDFKTGGTPLPPSLGSLVALGLPTDPVEEGDFTERTPAAVTALVESIRAFRQDWSSRSIRRALDDPSARERPWPVVCEAYALMARDPESQHPGRLGRDGPWWPAAERKCRPGGQAAARPKWCGKCHERTRFLLDEFGQAGTSKCPKCHPDAQARSA